MQMVRGSFGGWSTAAGITAKNETIPSWNLSVSTAKMTGLIAGMQEIRLQMIRAYCTAKSPIATRGSRPLMKVIEFPEALFLFCWTFWERRRDQPDTLGVP